MGGLAKTRISPVGDYYRQITEVDIGDVARELLDGRITQEADRRLECDCPHHASESKRSLHIMLDKQGWYCFACGVGGDVLQLVEFVQSGSVTRGHAGPMPESHRRARDFLAERAGLPTLSKHGLSPEALAEAEKAREVALRVYAVLTRLAEIYHDRLINSPDVLAWFTEKYRISPSTIAALKIGYADNLGLVKTLLAEGFTLRELSATGAFRPTPQDGLDPFFERRITFPYWSRGRVVYMIGRTTPWTPVDPHESGKYRKLPVHNDAARSYIAPCIFNDHLFNEDVLLGRPGRVVITEGITDCISLFEREVAAISPATVRIRDDDWDRIVPKLAGVRTVYLCHDNEPSAVGFSGSLATARALRSQGIDTRVAILPLDQSQIDARAALSERFAIRAGFDAGELNTRLDALADDDRTVARAMLEAGKLDVNSFFAAGHTAAEFERILTAARTPIELAIDEVPESTPDEELNRLLDPILGEIASLDDLEQARHLKLIQLRFGRSAVPIASLRKRVGAIARERRAHARKQKKRSRHRTDAPTGSCREAIDRVFADAEAAGEKPDYAKAAEAAYTWFKDHGAQFFRTRLGEPFLFFEDEVHWMDASDRPGRRSYQSLIYHQAGIVPTSTGGRTFYEVLADCVNRRGEMRDYFSWLSTRIRERIVYFNLNNDQQEIARMRPDGTERLRNGGNTDGVILCGSQKMAPLHFLPDADPAEADRLLASLILDNLACNPRDRLLVISWLSCFMLIDFAGTRPMLRFEGPSGSGKTTASKMISTLIFGSPQQKKSTDAANYTDGARNPLIVLDNIEVRQMTEELTTFMLTCVTGISKEKRKGGTDTDTVVERPSCLEVISKRHELA